MTDDDDDGSGEAKARRENFVSSRSRGRNDGADDKEGGDDDYDEVEQLEG